MRTLILSLVGCTALIAAAGCSAEVPSNDDTQVSVADDGIQQQATVNNMSNCAEATPEAQRTATKLAKYVMGGDAPALPPGAACDALKGALDTMRAGMAANKIYVNALGTQTNNVCGILSHLVLLQESTSTGTHLRDAIPIVQTQTAACLGQGVFVYFAPLSVSDSTGGSIWMDPEPATLTADLSSTQGAAAAAYYTSSLEPTVAKKWNATYGACGTAVNGGDACSTTALSSGQQATRMIQKNGTLCRCL